MSSPHPSYQEIHLVDDTVPQLEFNLRPPQDLLVLQATGTPPQAVTTKPRNHNTFTGGPTVPMGQVSKVPMDESSV